MMEKTRKRAQPRRAFEIKLSKSLDRALDKALDRFYSEQGKAERGTAPKAVAKGEKGSA